MHALSTPWPHVATGWLQWSAPRWLRRFDGVFHTPWYGLPFRQPVPMVATLHDLTFERHPEWFAPGRRRTYVVQARWAARTAGALVTVSHHVADDIMRTYGVPSERIFVATHGVDEVFAPHRGSSAARSRLGVGDRYVVAIGGHPRRNLQVAVEAWRAVRQHTQIDLVVVGANDIPVGDGIYGGRLDDDDWADVLAGAEALLYPTAYEGFGLPAIEAAASGTPVICARVGALPEVLGDTALWCETLTGSAFARCLELLLANAAFAEELRQAGLAHVAKLTGWPEAAAAHIAAYELASSAGGL